MQRKRLVVAGLLLAVLVLALGLGLGLGLRGKPAEADEGEMPTADWADDTGGKCAALSFGRLCACCMLLKALRIARSVCSDHAS